MPEQKLEIAPAGDPNRLLRASRIRLVAAAVCGASANIWQLRAALADPVVAVQVASNSWVWHLWMVLPWAYLLAVGWRLRHAAWPLCLFGIAAFIVIFAGILTWQFHLSTLPPAQRMDGVALMAGLQLGITGTAGLILWLKDRAAKVRFGG
jgi:hypothetical protein